MRPLLLAAVSLSVKHNNDEELVGVVGKLHRVGVGVNALYLVKLECAFLAAIDWNMESSRQTYSVYVFEMHSLVTLELPRLLQMAPLITEVFALLDALDPPTVDEDDGEVAQVGPQQ